MPKAVYNKVVIADYDDIVLLEGNHYFPPESVNMEYLQPSKTKSDQSWIGDPVYYDVIVGKKKLKKAAWSYPEPSNAARSIKDYVAFGESVKIIP